jgi:hypothetical protein
VNGGETLKVRRKEDTPWFRKAASCCSAICFADGRINFLKADGVTSLEPTQGQAFFYYGHQIERFCEEFGPDRFPRKCAKVKHSAE